MRAHFGPLADPRNEITIDHPRFRWIREHGTLHIPDVHAQNDFPRFGTAIRRSHISWGASSSTRRIHWILGARRTEVRPFTPVQIKLLETFANQAVIALENVRLFNELETRNRDLTEALEQQTATSEMLRVIATSPTDLQPVLNTLIANAVKLSGATKGHVRQLDGELLRVVAHYGETVEEVALLQSRPGGVGVSGLQRVAHSGSERPYRLRMLQQSVARTVSPHSVERERCCQYHCCARERLLE